MLDRDKMYTKDEIALLANGSCITGYSLNADNEPFENYVSNSKELTEEEIKLMDEGKLGFFQALNLDKLNEIRDEAHGRVWCCKVTPNALLQCTPEQRKQALDTFKQTVEQYNIINDSNDFYQGYWSGIYAFCNYLSAGDAVTLNNLRTSERLLDL